MSPLLILDLPSVYYRAFYALPSSLVDTNGHPINAIKGSLGIIAQLASKIQPKKIIAAVDESWRPQWRVDLLPEYKTHRLAADQKSELTPDELLWQIPYLQKLVKLLGISVIGKEDYEADDCIATLANAEGNSLIVTSDRDLFQLISKEKEISLYLQSDKKDPIWNYQRFKAAYGFEPQQYIDYAVLRGDPSDGLKGVAKVGEKTAAKLIQHYGTIEAVINNLGSDKSSSLTVAEKNILSSIEYLQKARQVTGLATNLELTIKQENLNKSEIAKLAAQLKVTNQINEILQQRLD